MTNSLLHLPPTHTAPPAGMPRGRRVAARLSALGSTVFKRTIAIVLFVALWQFAPIWGWVDDTFVPPFSQVLGAVWELAANGALWTNVSASLTRVLSGFAIAIATAIPTGLLIAWSRRVAEILGPLLVLFLNTSAVALVPVFILILGIGNTSKILLIAFSCFWPIVYNTISGAKNVDPLLVRSARSLGITGPRLFQKVILPAAVPPIFTGIRLSGAVGMAVLITAEMVGAKAGLGYLIISAQYNFQIPKMYAGILTIAAIGVALTQSLVWLERRTARGRAES